MIDIIHQIFAARSMNDQISRVLLRKRGKSPHSCMQVLTTWMACQYAWDTNEQSPSRQGINTFASPHKLTFLAQPFQILFLAVHLDSPLDCWNSASSHWIFPSRLSHLLPSQNSTRKRGVMAYRLTNLIVTILCLNTNFGSILASAASDETPPPVAEIVSADPTLFKFESVQLTEDALSTLNESAAALFAFDDATQTSTTRRRSSGCKLYPTDTLWPSPPVWTLLNWVLGKNSLIKTVPLASPCYVGWAYDAAKCASLLSNWTNSHIQCVYIVLPMILNEGLICRLVLLILLP